MLCPGVCNFKAPESHFAVTRSPTREKSHLVTSNQFLYNHLVTLFVPSSIEGSNDLSRALVDDCEYYTVTDLNLSHLVTKDFIGSFIKQGKLHALSTGTRIDCDNCVAVTPSGVLILHLNKTSFESLGLEGKVSHFHTKTKGKYMVRVDLKSSDFAPGTGAYTRLRARLEEFPQTFNLIVAWQPLLPDVCPSSIAKYFQDAGVAVSLSEPRVTSSCLYNLAVPELQSDTDYAEIAEWLGMLSTGCDPETRWNDEVSSYKTPEPGKYVSQMKLLQWRGFFTTQQISRFLETLEKLGSQENRSWLAIYVQGFSDSPVAWNESEHHFYINGDSSYLVIFNGANTVVCTQKCSAKRYTYKYDGK